MPLTLDGNGDISGLVAGALPANVIGAGGVIQVVSGYASACTTTSGTTFVDSGITASITPTSSANKILIIVNVNGLFNGGTANLGHKLSIVRNSTNIHLFCTYVNYIGTGVALLTAASSNYLDSPATTSATTYKLQFAKSDSTSGTVSVQHNSDVSSITLMEIAG